MFLKLFLLFTLLPSFELWLLFQVKSQIGLFETIWLVVLTGMIGASMAKNQGLMVLQELQNQTKQGQPPTQTILEGVLVLVGGVLLVTPGILTDAFGFSLIIPFTRKMWAPAVRSWLGKRVQMQGNFQHPFPGTHGQPQTSHDRHFEKDSSVLETPAQPSKSNGFSHPKF